MHQPGTRPGGALEVPGGRPGALGAPGRGPAALLAYTGLRIGETLSADVIDLAVERGHRVLHVTRTAVWWHSLPRAAHALEEYLAGRPGGPLFVTETGALRHEGAFKVVQRVARRAGIAGAGLITPHSLRHSFMTLSPDAGIPLRDVQDGAGHARLSSAPLPSAATTAPAIVASPAR